MHLCLRALDISDQAMWLLPNLSGNLLHFSLTDVPSAAAILRHLHASVRSLVRTLLDLLCTGGALEACTRNLALSKMFLPLLTGTNAVLKNFAVQ